MGEMGRHIKIIAYKEPSRIHKVDYQLTVDELNAMTISDDFEIDKVLNNSFLMSILVYWKREALLLKRV